MSDFDYAAMFTRAEEDAIVENARRALDAAPTTFVGMDRVDVAGHAIRLRPALENVIRLLDAYRSQGNEPAAQAPAFDLTDEDTYFVLTEALAEWASEQRHQAANDPDSSERRTRWAATADSIRDRIEDA